MHRKKEFGKRTRKAPDKWYANSLVNIMLISILLFTMLLVSTSQALAITGSGGNISLNSEIGSVAYDATGSTFNAYGGASTIYGIFGASSFDGRLGLLGGQNNVSASLSLTTPTDGTVMVGTTGYFNYVPSGDIINCTLYIDDVLRGFNSDPTLGGVNTFIVNSLTVGAHSWNVSCAFGENSLVESRTFTTIIFSGYNANSTNIVGLNASAIPNLTLVKSAGGIVFDGYTDLSSGVDLNANIRISQRSIYIDSVAAPMLNKPATLTMNDVPYSNIVIWRDGAVCDDCSVISLSGNTLVFSVTGFSEYTVTSTSRLETYDDSDFASILQNQTVMFTANYTNITSGLPITGSCDIIIQGDGTHAMTYNVTSGTHQYSSSFADKGIRAYTVQCTPAEPGYDYMELNATFTVSNLPPPSFANTKATTGPTSSMNTDTAPAVINAGANNLTELSFDMQQVTKTWQGYYGNVVGTVQLTNANSSSMYNWEMISPNGEVYATRSPTVTWENVRCANFSELQTENTVLGVYDTDGDSVTNTFRNTSSFETFYVGSVVVNTTQNCYATHLNDASGVQSTNYAEILLSDSTLMIYTSLLDPGVSGFDGNDRDFEMLVGEYGQNEDQNPTMYYFYLEIG